MVVQRAASAPRTMQFGVHLMIDGYAAGGAAMTDAAALRGLLERLPGEMGMHPICAPVVVEAARRDFAAAGLPEHEFYADAFTSERDKLGG